MSMRFLSPCAFALLCRRRSSVFLILLIGFTSPAWGEANRDLRYILNRSNEALMYPVGVTVLPSSLDPTVRKWYVPQEFIQEYRWGGWRYTNYAKDFYRRYLEPDLYGSYYYDTFGHPILRGWLVLDWRQTQPRLFGNAGKLGMSFPVIGGDSKGEYRYTITHGGRLVLTPMTLSRSLTRNIPGTTFRPISGLHWDFESDLYQATALLAHISEPGRQGSTNNTHLYGGHARIHLSDFATAGVTFLNAHQSSTTTGFGTVNPFWGGLTTDQSKHPISVLQIRLSDDSPEDGEAGAAFYSEQIVITDVDGNAVIGDEIGFDPIIEGGIQRIGYLSADGNETIVLLYDFTHPLYRGPEPDAIKQVTFHLGLANDYRVEVTSDRQTDAGNVPAYLTVLRAPGNVKDKTNLRRVRFDYGLPTANQILGFTLNVLDLGGFSVQGELNINTRYYQYPNRTIRRHHVADRRAHAWYLNVAYRRHPWLAFGEFFGMDDGYTTRSFLTTKDGRVDYSDSYSLYEFVADDDDQDGVADWRRFSESEGDAAVFPGLDENNDGISDYNQNRNFYPDYEEPFLRHTMDRPEYLFGMDMNNNGWIDRFENDDLPDYPYRKDHLGYNVYGTAWLGPDVRIMAGQLREALTSGDGHHRMEYAVFTLDRSYPRVGRVRLFQSVKKVKDNIPDDLVQWIQPIRTGWTMREIPDPLAARNTWINTTFLELDYASHPELEFVNKVKYETYRQRDSKVLLQDRGARARTTLFGVINKVDYARALGGLLLRPRWKSEYFLERPYLKDASTRRELRETFSLLLRTGIKKMHRGRTRHQTDIESGIELTYFNQFDPGAPAGFEEDFFGIVFITQLVNSWSYMGYRVITHTGYKIDRHVFEEKEPLTTNTSFFRMYAGIQE